MHAYWAFGTGRIYCGDCREVVPELDDRFTAVVTDPPYGLTFMGKGWDRGVPGEAFWRVVGDACLPGVFLLAFGGTRTFHRLMCAIEDAGWELRDTIMWVFGQGWAGKSFHIARGMRKAARGVPQGVADPGSPYHGQYRTSKTGGKHGESDHGQGYGAGPGVFVRTCGINKTRVAVGYRPNAVKPGVRFEPETAVERMWNGYGTALKPAYEPIVLAMKGCDGTFVRNALAHGVAGLNIDACRGASAEGRWPANLIHDGSEDVLEVFDRAGGRRSGGAPKRRFADKTRNTYGRFEGEVECPPGREASAGSAARFFYTAKASQAERTAWGRVDNLHPTVKPVALMAYLIRLVTMPERNLVLDPFCGSGSTGIACQRLGVPFVLIDSDEQSCEWAAKRLELDEKPPEEVEKSSGQMDLFAGGV